MPVNDDTNNPRLHAPTVPVAAKPQPPKTLAQTPSQAQTAAALSTDEALPQIPGYLTLRKLGEGGMAEVFAARDQTLDRPVAIKVMKPGHSVERFVVESRITARLPHPNIPPVHTLGPLADGRPYLVMKLVSGRTLAAVLSRATEGDQQRLLAQFEAVCQAVGFAHNAGIVHRDLKPSNVMVGAFGEVQVMDWGLAKDIGRHGALASGVHTPAGSLGADATDPTTAGQVKGTPAYMAPEQARGEAVDTRADVFALGGILTAILTGRPPFVGNSVLDTIIRAAQADLADAFAWLDGCGADPKLVALAKWCLAARPDDRPTDGTRLATAVASYRLEVEGRLRRAERERAAAEARAAEEENTRHEAEARAEEQRKRRRVQWALAAAVLLLASAGAGFAWWRDKQLGERRLAAAEQSRLDGERRAAEARAESEAVYKERQARQGVETNLKLGADLRRQYKFAEAGAALAQAADLAEGGPPRLRAAVEQARRDLALVVKLDDVRYRKWAWVAEADGTGRFNTRIAPPEYRAAFAAYGLDLTTLSPADAAKRIAASGVKVEIVAAVDDWALYEPDAARSERLLEVARRADPGPWTDRLRDPKVRADKAAVGRLAAEAEADVKRLTPAVLNVLAELMRRRQLDATAFLTAARVVHPSEFELAFALGLCYVDAEVDFETGPFEAARALRPDNLIVLNNLGNALHANYDLDAAVAVYRRAIELDPKYAAAYNGLGVALDTKGKAADALAALRRAIELDPKYAPSHSNLGTVLRKSRDLNGAIAAFKKAIELDPEDTTVYSKLGAALREKGDLDGAIVVYKKAIGIDPEDAVAYCDLGDALRQKGDLNGAVKAYERAIEIDDKDAATHSDLAAVLRQKGDLEGAIREYKQAIEIDDEDATTHKHLGDVYFERRKYADCIECARTAIRADRKYADAHALLGFALREVGDLPGARKALADAARLDKKWAKELAKLARELPVAPPPRAVP